MVMPRKMSSETSRDEETGAAGVAARDFSDVAGAAMVLVAMGASAAGDSNAGDGGKQAAESWRRVGGVRSRRKFCLQISLEEELVGTHSA
jgi:hypothetical protein